MNIAVWFSCGVASAVAAKKTVERYYKNGHTVSVIYNPVIEEDQDNLRFLKDIEKWIEIPIKIITNPDFTSASAVEVWNKRKFMSGPKGAPCTIELKKKARQWYEKHCDTKIDMHVLGFTADEVKRHQRFVESERSNVLPVLIEENLTKQDCFDIILKAGIEVPRVYKMGYPNANCIGCVKATSPTYWNLVREKHPGVFALRAEQSRRIGARLVRVKGQRIFLDELDLNDKGQDLKEFNIDCGVFCEEKR
jgi:hypothetical protein